MPTRFKKWNYFTTEKGAKNRVKDLKKGSKENWQVRKFPKGTIDANKPIYVAGKLERYKKRK